MTIETTMLERSDVCRNTDKALTSASKGPVFIGGENGKRTHVILSDAEYQFNMRIVFSTLSPQAKQRLQMEYQVESF